MTSRTSAIKVAALTYAREDYSVHWRDHHVEHCQSAVQQDSRDLAGRPLELKSLYSGYQMGDKEPGLAREPFIILGPPQG
jgi:hypothetical protein